MGLISSKRLPVPAPLDSTQPQPTRLREYMVPVRGKWLLGTLVAVGSTVLAVSIPQVLSWIIDHLVAGGSPTAATVWAGGVLVLILGLGQAGLNFLRRMLTIDTSTTVEQDMRIRLYDRLMRLPLTFHDRWQSGQLLTRSTGDLGLIRRWISFGSVQAVTSAASVLTGLIYLALGSWILALIYLCSIPLLVGALWRFKKKMTALTRRSQQLSGDLATDVEESVRGIRVLKALGQGTNALERFSYASAQLRDTEIQRSKVSGASSVLASLVQAVTLALSLLVGIQLIAAGALTLGQLAAYFATVALLSPHLERSVTLLNMWLVAKVAVERHAQVIREAESENIRLLVDESQATQTVVESHTQGGARLTLKKVSYSHDGVTPLLQDICLDLAPGKILALVGATGSGKSTLLQLIPRLYTQTSGSILLDGQDTAEIPLPLLRSQMSFAFEEPLLFSLSVRDNVLLGLENSGRSEAELDEILAKALRISAADFVTEMPEGVNSRVGEEGMNLSGGQRQRLSLARAIATNPRLLLLDDPLSALDIKTEEAVLSMLKEELPHTTLVLTAHRPSTLACADEVALIHNGTIALSGSHAQLMKDPAYRKLMQTEPKAGQL